MSKHPAFVVVPRVGRVVPVVTRQGRAARSQVVCRAQAAAAASPAPAARRPADDGVVYLERLPNWRQPEQASAAQPDSPPSTSGRDVQPCRPMGRRGGLNRHKLELDGHYMMQVKILDQIFSRARSQTASHATPAAASTTRAATAPSASSAPSAAAAAAAAASGSSRRKGSSPLLRRTASRHPGRAAVTRTAGAEGQAAAGSTSLAPKPAEQERNHRGELQAHAGGGGMGPGVLEVLESLQGLSGVPLEAVIAQASPVTGHQAMLALGSQRRFKDVQLLLAAMDAAGTSNEHTHAVVLQALDLAGRFDMSLQHFEGLERRGVDVGPVCASMLIKLCAQRRDLRTALDIFYRLSGQSTLNRYTYNCLIHLCAVMGQVDEAFHVLRMMHEDTGPDTSPDACTYGELAKAVVNSKRWQLLPRLFRDIHRSQAKLTADAWVLLITAAGRAEEPQLAQELHQVARRQVKESLHVDNAMMAAVARHVTLAEILDMYRAILKAGLRPDEYTFNAILTTMCKGGASVYAVEDLVSEMEAWGVKINTYVGTTLISAYRRAPELSSSDPRTTALLLEKVHDVLAYLVSQRQANTHTFGLVMAMHAQLGDVHGVYHLLQRMRQAGVVMDGKTCMAVAQSFEENGFVSSAEEFLMRTKRPRPGVRDAVPRRAWGV